MHTARPDELGRHHHVERIASDSRAEREIMPVVLRYVHGCEAHRMPLRKSIQITGTTKTGLLYHGSVMRDSFRG